MYLHDPWIYTPEELDADQCLISPEELHHLRHVLRCKNNIIVIAFNGRGTVRSGYLKLSKNVGHIDFLDKRQVSPVPSPYVQSILFLPNNVATFEACLRKACELGVHIVQPVIGKRTEGQYWTSPLWTKRQPRFQRICIESCKQAKNPFLPHIQAPLQSHQLSSIDLGACFHGSLDGTLNNFNFSKNLTKLSVIVGPEGGFSAREETSLKEISTEIHLPTYVLRVETAMVSLHSILQTQYALFTHPQ